MIIFDWRQFEPALARRDHWPRFATTDLEDRYAEDTIGHSAWREVVARVFAATTMAALPEVLGGFYRETASLRTRPLQPCVFISHQRADTHRGERVACLLDHCGLNGWLDVHDPTLIAANQLPQNDPRRSVLIAAIIEIALLNSTHIIALHSANSNASRWVPYEFGRAKSHSIVSWQAAGWFEAGQSPRPAATMCSLPL
jgi:hypothetical protein